MGVNEHFEPVLNAVSASAAILRWVLISQLGNREAFAWHVCRLRSDGLRVFRKLFLCELSSD